VLKTGREVRVTLMMHVRTVKEIAHRHELTEEERRRGIIHGFGFVVYGHTGGKLSGE
jgi:hypothetical protein